MERFLRLLASLCSLLRGKPDMTAQPPSSGSSTPEPEPKLELGRRAANFISVAFGSGNVTHDAPTIISGRYRNDTMILGITPSTTKGPFQIDNVSHYDDSIRLRFIYYGEQNEMAEPICCWFGFTIVNGGEQIREHHLTDTTSLDAAAAAACNRVFADWAHHFSKVLQRRFRMRGNTGGP